MFHGGYYTDILLHEIKGKPYNKKWLLIKHWIWLIGMTTLTMLGLIYAL
jgi:hypothetical protein